MASGARVGIINPRPELLAELQIARLSGIVHVFDTEDEALDLPHVDARKKYGTPVRQAGVAEIGTTPPAVRAHPGSGAPAPTVTQADAAPYTPLLPMEPGSRFITVTARAKINLAFAVGPARPKDQVLPHRLWFAPLVLADELTLAPLPAGASSTHKVCWAPRRPPPLAH